MRGCALDLSGWGGGIMVNSCEHGDERKGCVNTKELVPERLLAS